MVMGSTEWSLWFQLVALGVILVRLNPLRGAVNRRALFFSAVHPHPSPLRRAGEGSVLWERVGWG